MFYKLAIILPKNRLIALKELLKKIETQTQERGMSDSEVLSLKLAEDMFDLKRQIQISCDNAKWAAGRIAKKDIPSISDTETTFQELIERIDATIAYLDTFSQKDFENIDEVKVELPYFKDMHFTAEGYLLEYFIPNFHFHLVTAYDIARANGFQIGKSDFMFQIPLIPNK